ncbi:phosphotransferase family protein [Pseudonocardia sp. RS010]|uniref:phosphotransferase family protein n=1 Tax=Pseudonocardia sp. RS010 TaxID=3385979 RepID=UPI0039A384B9
MVPATVAELTPEWLTGALCADVPGAEVTSFDLGGGSDGTASRRAITVAYNEAGQAAGLPTALYSKMTPTLLNRLLVGVTGAAGMEALFYGRIRPHLDIGAPAGYHGAWDPRTCRSFVLTEDITATRGAVFGDATTIHVDRAGAESMVRELARYHGGLWEDPRLDHEWTDLVDTHTWQRTFNTRTRFDSGAMLGFRIAPDEIPRALHDRKAEVRKAFDRSLAINARGPKTLVHHDVHPGNWFRLPDGSLNLYDWQGIAKGNWAIDFSYAITAALEPEDRRAWEHDLLEQYLQLLGDAGGKPPSFEDAWLAYRQQTLHGLILWLYTVLVGRVQEIQSDAHVRILIRRTAQAVVDLETLDALDGAG